MNKKQTEKPQYRWRLELTDEQFQCIARGMEFYGRILAGQLNVLDEATPQTIRYEDTDPLKLKMFPELSLNASYSWNGGSPSEWHDKEIARSYQIYREMRHQDVLARGIDNVYTSETLRTSKAEPLKVERI